MKVLFYIALAIACLWTGGVVLVNKLWPSEADGFVGGNTIAPPWLLVAVLGAAVYWG